MNGSEQDDLRELSSKNVCPNCGEQIPAGNRHLYGAGAFCSLACVAKYNAAELIEKHNRRLAAAQRHRNS